MAAAAAVIKHASLSPACDDGCSGVLLQDLEEAARWLATANVSRLAVASYLRLAELEEQRRDVQVSV